MSGSENLIPMNKRSKDEARASGRKGGVASGESRRRRKLFRETMETILSLPVNNYKKYNELVQIGIPLEDIDNSTLMLAGLFKAAERGDISAYKEIAKLVGEETSGADAGKLSALIEGLKDGE